MCLLALLVMGPGPPEAVRAASIDVPCDVPALIAALHTANGNTEADTLSLAPGCIYTLTAVDNDTDGPNGLPSISSEITVNGNGAIIERSDAAGTPEFRILHVDPSGDLALNALTVRNGNLSADGGGGIYGLDAVLTLTDSTISGNRASSSGGIANVWGRLTMVRSTVSGNQAQGSGGGVVNADGYMTLTDSTISGNTAGEDGGGIYNETGLVTLIDSTVSDNTGDMGGGGLYNVEGTVELTNSDVTGNRTDNDGGGIYNETGAVTLTNSRVSDNEGFGGGGIEHRGGTLTLTDSTVSDNTGIWGGGIDSQTPESIVTLTNCTVSGNWASGGGGGIWHSQGSLTLVNSTVSGNRTSGGGDGGGILNRDGTAELVNSTVTGNQVGSRASGHGIYNTGGTVELANTIVAAQPMGTDCAGDPVTSQGHNLDSDGTCVTDDVNGDITDPNPLLGLLQDNGGPTETHALLAGSPAIDAGDQNACPSTDQRGLPRPQDGDGDGVLVCDIGAYELEAETNVELISFTAQPGPGYITLAWETGTEVGVAGFNLWRSETPEGIPIQINDTLIAAQGDPVSGASYTYVDDGVEPGVTYYYRLEDVNVAGQGALHGPVSATAQRQYRIYMPIVIR